MGPPPAVVIVVRHGARLDAADKQWHLKSPTPYDPPLTYGGWTQCRNLGNRIAALLQTREEIFNEANRQEASKDSSANGYPWVTKSGKPRRKKHRVIIHSSPFLRCVQTGIAISSGMSQYNGHNATSKFERPGPPTSRSRGDSSQERSSPSLATIADEDFEPVGKRAPSPSAPGGNTRIKLRVDAFLGEWLSPEYYESITPPPDSVLMLAAAKAELLHRGEPISAEERRPRTVTRKNSTAGLWGSPTNSPTVPNGEVALEDSIALDPPARPKPRDRAASHSGDDRGLTSPRLSMSIASSPNRKNGYVPPSPLYAISPQDPIPLGYVAHARDHCVDVDIQWDSMRHPQNWGDGGRYGEEWSAMHRRFRHGLDGMISWYRHHHESSHQRHGHLRTLHPPTPSEDEDDDTDTVLLLISHGAGCNALIGALTNQPVLLDIGMASLTMAVRRERPLSPPPPVSPTGRRPSATIETQISQEYEVALTASTDHLRNSSATSPTASPLEIGAPKSLRSLAPGLLQRSNTLPLRPPPRTAPPTRHISPAPSKTRSTSMSKVSFAQSPLNPNSPNAAQTPAPKTWMDMHQTSPSPKAPAPVASQEPKAPEKPTWSPPIKTQSGGGLWQAKPTSQGPGLWQRPSTVPKSGPGSAATPAIIKPAVPAVEKKAAFVSPGAPPAEDHRMEQWMVDPTTPMWKPRSNGTHKGDQRTVSFADAPKNSKREESISPGAKSRDDTEDEHEGSLGEELSRWHDEERAGEHAARIYKTPSEIRLHELGMKRRWTMNDERNQEREKEEDWRMEAWM